MNASHREELARVAHAAMLERRLIPEFSEAALQQLATIDGPATASEQTGEIRDLRKLPWCSIDNDDSRDLDQVSCCEDLGGGDVRIRVGVADVDALVARNTPIDQHARQNTTSVYTPAKIFPMLPEKLSTDFSSLNPDVERLAVVIEYVVTAGGGVRDSGIYRATVFNHAKLAYNAVAAWFDGEGEVPEPLARTKGIGMEAQLRVQDAAAQRLRKRRHEEGALDFQSLESRPVFEDGRVVSLRVEKPNRAKQLIEEFMIAANGISAQFLEERKTASFRRVVRSPERWQRIVGVAAEHGEKLPQEPDAKALEQFLRKRRAADPLRFPDLSLVIVKLMGNGEYVVDVPGDDAIGHFGLAVRDYSHTTAPNRRFPDILTHRLLKASLAKRSPPYGIGELEALAQHCTEMESAAAKVERQVRKSAGALMLENRIGDVFEGVITGAADKGTFVRVFDPPVEGRVVKGERSLKVGAKVRVKLVATDFEKGFLDFVRE